MHSPKNYVLGLLALTTLGGAFLAWQQYGELVELRAGALDRDERRDLQERVTELEKTNRALRDQLAVLQGAGELDPLLAEAAPERAGTRSGDRDRGRGGDPRSRGPEGFQQQAAALRELMAKPEVQAMLSQQQKAAIEARYAALFRNLNLTPEQADKLKTLLAERGNTRRDIEEAARAQGIDPRQNPEAYRKLFTNAQDELNASIKSVIGDQGFAQLQNFEQTMPERNLVESLQQRLSYSGLPLTATQAEQLVQILATNTPQRTATPGVPSSDAITSRGPGFGPPGGDFGRGGPDIGRIIGPGFGPPPGGPGGGSAIVTPGAVAQAQTILAPPQVAALQSIQQQQQAQQQLQQLVRETLAKSSTSTKSGAPAGGTTTPGTGGTGAAPPRKRGGGE